MSALGRFRRGDTLAIGCTTLSVPDYAPIGVVMDSSSNVVLAIAMPISGTTNMVFSLPVFIGTEFDVGNYSVSYQFAVGGIAGSVSGDTFTVIPGGDSGGNVISLYSFNRPEANYVVAQLSSGRLAQGRNPSF